MFRGELPSFLLETCEVSQREALLATFQRNSSKEEYSEIEV